MSNNPRHTRNNPVSELVSVPNPEGILRLTRSNPTLRSTEVHPPVSVANVTATSLFHREINSFLNPPDRSGIGVLYPSPSVWSPIASQLVASNTPSLVDSVELDQLSSLASPTLPQLRLPHPPRRSIPGAFDPCQSFAMTDVPAGNRSIENEGDHPVQPTGQPGVTGTEVTQEQVSIAEVQAKMRAEMNSLRALIQQMMSAQISTPAPATQPKLQEQSGITDLQATPVPHALGTRHVSSSADPVFNQQVYSSTPLHQNPFHRPLVPPASQTPSVDQVPVSAIDPLRFRITDFPEYKGKYGDVAAYRIWRHKVERLFLVKGLVLDSDKFSVLPLLLSTNPAASWCRRSGDFTGHTWLSAMKEMESVILPADWLDKVKQQIRELAMRPNEHISAFCARARVLQEAAGLEECSEEALAWAIVGGSTSLFRSIQQRDQIIKSSINPVSQKFSFAAFEQKACLAWDFALELEPRIQSRIPRSSNNLSATPTVLTSQNQRGSAPFRAALSPEEQAARNARFMAYMRSIGLCPRCKTSCLKWLGGCTADTNSAYYPVPPDFARSPPYPPPKSSNTVSKTCSATGRCSGRGGNA
ncbi:uncharacterized protein MELLADRAFT_113273 [Melampsora larici-populina 98AG31]|uniref:Retrotransposon gag domain-containing protein n=1 Tax=Melampsora larici-populina (strain 98AG31 / pathotype 3-4-7) TaxID=747676 RepID=F4S9B7_MELLP|nr:uncharacterized protein MELLADRAFT_113273 [Melampsora larici-populina 98AG31]EGF98791.1 hypothetical protein MELLADRAFT_113273 [Melampsora larici-populina 98AG31]